MAESQQLSDDCAPPAPRLDRLGTTLRRAYEDIATEPLPEAFEDLLRQLR